jgi:hypothetical protein
VDVQVEHRLPGGGADIDADVVAVGPVTLVNERSCRVYQGYEGGLLRFSRVEKTQDVSSWNDERMSGGHRVTIPQRDRQLILSEHPVFWGIAERAGCFGLGRGHILIVLRVGAAGCRLGQNVKAPA